MTRRFLALAGILLLASTAVAVASGGGGEKPAAAQQVTIKVLIMDSGEWGTPAADKLVFAEASKATGVNLDIEIMPGDAAHDILNARLAAGDLPDAMVITKPMTDQYGPQGALKNLAELFKGAPNLQRKFSLETNPWIYTPEGKLFFLPAGNSPYTAWGWVWRQDIADELGIKQPQTIDDWVAAWRKVKAAKPDSIPWMTLWGLPMSHLAAAYGIGGDARGPYTFRDGVFSHPWISDEYREILTLAANMYKEGILWSEFAAADWDTFQAAQASAKTFSTTFYSGTMFNYVTDDIKKNIKAVPAPKGPKGYSGHDWMGISSYWGFGIPATSKNPEAAIRFMDYLNSDEGEILWMFGKEGVTYERKDGRYKFLDSVIAAAKADGRSVDMYNRRTYNIGISGFVPFITKAALWLSISPARGDPIGGEQQSGAIVATSLAPYPPPVWSTTEEQTRINTLKTDMDTYHKEWQLKFITGKEPLSKWSEYVAGLKKLGVDELMTLVNAGYARYLKVAGKQKGYVPPIKIDTTGMLEMVGLK